MRRGLIQCNFPIQRLDAIKGKKDVEKEKGEKRTCLYLSMDRRRSAFTRTGAGSSVVGNRDNKTDRYKPFRF